RRRQAAVVGARAPGKAPPPPRKGRVPPLRDDVQAQTARAPAALLQRPLPRSGARPALRGGLGVAHVLAARPLLRLALDASTKVSAMTDRDEAWRQMWAKPFRESTEALAQTRANALPERPPRCPCCRNGDVRRMIQIAIGDSTAIFCCSSCG